MLDINGITIKVGDKVKTQQPSGGILPPAKASTGIVEETVHGIYGKTLQIRYRRKRQDWDSFILLKGMINEIIKD